MEDVTEHSKMAAFVWLAIAVGLAILLAISYYFTQQRKPKREATDAAKPRGQPVDVGDTAGGVRRRRGARMNRTAANADAMWNDSDEELSDADVRFEDKDGKKVGAKKQKKLEMKAERREARENEVEEREERKNKEAQLAAEKAKEEEERRRREVGKTEEERLRKEEQERIEHEAYLKMKEEFTIDDSGEVGVLSEEESQSLLRKFVDHVKQQKVVLLEDLATEFNLKVQDTINRLEELQEMGELTGVMDDRGKFIYISREELEAVARFIRQRGRVSISDLAESSNELIKMQRTCEPAVDKLVEG